MNEKLEVLLDEQKFPYFDMSKEERNYYLNIIRNCKDICDTENKVGDFGKCEIHQIVLRKNGNAVTFNGILSLGEEQNIETRCIRGELYADKDMILVYMSVERLGNVEPKEYSVTDEFKLENDVLKRKTRYDYIEKDLIQEIKDRNMKGRLK